MNFVIYATLFVTLLVCNEIYSNDNSIVSARVESCPGCSLNRLPEVKKFIFEDLPKYDIEFKKIQGAIPELVLLNNKDEEVERLQLSKLSRKECNELLAEKGFVKMDEYAKEEF